MPVQATSGAASYDAFGGGVAAVPQYIEEVFQTWLYTGNGSTQTITNGIDLAGKGGLVWIKDRDSGAKGHALFDTARGVNKKLQSQSTNGEFSSPNQLTAFNSNGFALGSESDPNGSGTTYASWTFREQPKFFDVVTYTGNGANNRVVPHNLGSVPGMIITKRTADTSNWGIYHRSLGLQSYILLNTTAAAVSTANGTDIASVSATDYVLYPPNRDIGYTANELGVTYVAYLFAHNAGGFGLSGSDNVISCGSVVGAGGSGTTVTLGYEPQWILIKNASSSQDWWVVDNMRGLVATVSASAVLRPNLSDAETTGFSVQPTSTGFTNFVMTTGQTYIYIAIRRGPMKVPTTGTSVFAPAAAAGNATVTTNFPVDLSWTAIRAGDSTNTMTRDRLRGLRYLSTSDAAAETTYSLAGYSNFASNTTINNPVYGSSAAAWWSLQRAPGFFDVVCWTGDGTGAARNHNLTVYPELVISKLRNGGAGFGAWGVQNNINPSAKQTGVLNTTAAFSSSGATSPTATVFYPSDDQSGANYVTYLFASAPGVSKVGSYTGTGTTQQINCGFTAGSRFVLIKRTDSTGDWYVWDSARGIVAGNDPYLLLNSTAAEVTSTDWVDTAASGFELSNAGGNLANSNGGTYIFLAIA